MIIKIIIQGAALARQSFNRFTHNQEIAALTLAMTGLLLSYRINMDFLCVFKGLIFLSRSNLPYALSGHLYDTNKNNLFLNRCSNLQRIFF